MTWTTAVLLAAGAGTRLGLGPKALLPFRGGTLLDHAAWALRDGGCDEVVVVIGAAAAAVRAVPLPDGCRFVENPDWAGGMGSSFRAGADTALNAADSPDAVLVALVDQPGMTAQLIAALLSAHVPGRMTAAGYARAADPQGRLRRGNPVVFSPGHLRAAAAQATGDAGARAYLTAHDEDLDVVDCSALSDGADVDSPADLHLLG